MMHLLQILPVLLGLMVALVVGRFVLSKFRSDRNSNAGTDQQREKTTFRDHDGDWTDVLIRIAMILVFGGAFALVVWFEHETFALP